MRVSALSLLTLLLICVPAFGGNPWGNVYWLDSQNRVTIRLSHDARPVGGITSIGAHSEGGYLMPIADEASIVPFQFLVSNNPTDITASAFGNFLTLPAYEFTTFVRYDLSRALADGVEPHEDISVTSEAGLCGPGFQIRCHVMGDLDFDFAVNFKDFQILAGNYGMRNASWPDGDLNWNKKVDFADFLRLADKFDSEAATVPEPATNFLMALGAFAVMRFRFARDG